MLHALQGLEEFFAVGGPPASFGFQDDFEEDEPFAETTGRRPDGRNAKPWLTTVIDDYRRALI